MKIQVVIGANYGDEGKGLVSGCLAREAAKRNEKTLTCFYNGTIQRAHTFNGKIHHCLAAGEEFGSDTFYDKMFVVDPIALMITQSTPIIDERCRVILPCDVVRNRREEQSRGTARHGSCGLGLFEAVKRSRNFNQETDIRISDFFRPYELYQKLKVMYDMNDDELYNLLHFMEAAEYVVRKCKVATLAEITRDYDTVIYEGGQGLLLDQSNKDDFPHLTPSSTGSHFIQKDFQKMGIAPELFYVSRSYMTRHGAGPMESECDKQDINPDIVDTTNQPNEWQGSLRFGRLNTDSLWERIKADADKQPKDSKINIVFTHLNYTGGKLETTNGRQQIIAPKYINSIYYSDQKDFMTKGE